MRAFLTGLVAVSAMTLAASAVSAANTPSFPIKLEHSNFSYAPQSLPPGCQLTSSWTGKSDTPTGTITCQSKAEWDYGFTVGDDMQADCPTDDSKTPYVCHVHRKGRTS